MYLSYTHGRHVVHGSVLFITTVTLCIFLFPKRSAHNFLCKYALYVHICAVYIYRRLLDSLHTAKGKCPDWRLTVFHHNVLVPARPDNGWHLLCAPVRISLKNNGSFKNCFTAVNFMFVIVIILMAMIECCCHFGKLSFL